MQWVRTRRGYHTEVVSVEDEPLAWWLISPGGPGVASAYGPSQSVSDILAVPVGNPLVQLVGRRRRFIRLVVISPHVDGCQSLASGRQHPAHCCQMAGLLVRLQRAPLWNSLPCRLTLLIPLTQTPRVCPALWLLTLARSKRSGPSSKQSQIGLAAFRERERESSPGVCVWGRGGGGGACQ